MAKLKSNSGAKKRFTLTGSGKIKRKHAYHSHILTKKTKKQKRNLDHFAIIEKVDVNRIKEMLVLYSSNHVQLERSRKHFPQKEVTASKKVKIYA